MKIDFLIGENSYSTILPFSRALASALERLGVQTQIYWVGEGHFFHAFYDILADPPDLTCSFSDISLDSIPLGNLWTIPHLNLLVDPPVYFLHQLRTHNGWISCVDQLDCAFVNEMGFNRAFFFPHAAEASLITEVNTTRPYEAVFFGTCIDYEQVGASWPKEKKELLHAAADLVLSRHGLSIAQALKMVNVSTEDFIFFHHQVDLYIRGKDRVALVNSIKDTSVTIWGEGPWKKYCPHHKICPPLHFDQTIEIMKKSQIVLNSSPRFKSGGHERIFYGLMCGAYVHTGHNSFLEQAFPSLCPYYYGEWGSPIFTQLTERAKAGQNAVLNAHTWDHRAEALLATLRS